MSNGIIQYSNNQCLDFFQSRRLEYDSLNYRSEAEIAIAKAIDKHNRDGIDLEVYYIPNGVIVTPEARTETSFVKIESDFLIFYQGVTAVLEVDGSQHGEPSVAKKDTKKERHWKDKIRGMNVFVVERFSAKECLESPDKVLARFLKRITVKLCWLKSYQPDIGFYDFDRLDVDEDYLIGSMLAEYYSVYKEYFKRWRKYESLTPSSFLEYAKNVSCPVSFDGYKFTFLQNKEYIQLDPEGMKTCSIEWGLEYEFESVEVHSVLYPKMTSNVLESLQFTYSGNGDKDNLDNYHFTTSLTDWID